MVIYLIMRYQKIYQNSKMLQNLKRNHLSKIKTQNKSFKAIGNQSIHIQNLNVTIASKESDVLFHELILIRNLNYSGSINCVNMQNQVINNPYSHQQKCFLQLEIQEQQNDFSQIYYGQRIVLVNIKSEQNVMINLDMPSQKRGSFSVNLSSQIGHQSILRIMPSSSTKKIGDKIQYNDQLFFQQDSNRQYYLKLKKDESRYANNKFIDINAHDCSDSFHLHKIKHYLNNIAQIIHQQSQITVGTCEKQLQSFIANKTALIVSGNNEQQQQQQESFALRTLDLNKYLISEYKCKLKSLFTQQYLSVDLNNEKRLQLTSEYTQDEYSVFYINRTLRIQ